jgi:hypothetical protein
MNVINIFIYVVWGHKYGGYVGGKGGFCVMDQHTASPGL